MQISSYLSFVLFIFSQISINGAFSTTKTPAIVVGTVYCDTCFKPQFSKPPNHFIPGALVAVECIDEKSRLSFREEVKTNNNGEFKVKLPFYVSKHVKRIKRCAVKLLSSSQPYCSIAASTSSSSFKRLKSRNPEKYRVFSAGFFTFKPLNQPEICSQKPIKIRDVNPSLPDHGFPPPIQDPIPDPSPLPILPPITDLPIPKLPPLLPTPPAEPISLEEKKTDVLKPDFFFPPNPLTPPSLIPPNPLNPPSLIPPNPLNPPSIVPPIPLIPSPPTLPLPPLPFQPPPSTLIPPIPANPNLPPVPVVTPPSPPPSVFPFPFPPIFPGIPPASTSGNSKP